MPEFSCPDPEVLASFIDGRLQGAQRREVVEHLDRCDDCYEVFTETVDFQAQDEEHGRLLVPQPSRWRPSPQWLWATSAVAAVLVAAIILPGLLGGPDEVRLSSDDLASVIDAEGSLSTMSPWSPPDSFGMAPSSEDLSFRVGVRLVDLRTTLRTGDSDALRLELGRLQRLVNGTDLESTLSKALAAALDAIGNGRLDEVNGIVTELELEAEGSLDAYALNYGKWAEAGRLAASCGAPALYSTPAFSDFTAVVGEREESPDAIQLASLLRSGPRSESELSEAKTLFTRIVNAH